MRILWRIGVAVLLTILTQLGGVAYVISLFFRRRLLAFGLLYTALSITALIVAPHFGRTALPCLGDRDLKVASPLYCALNRQYVSPPVKDLLSDLASTMTDAHPNTQTLVLDANFPFLDGFPLLPHLSHDDGDKVDLAFFYADETGYLRGAMRSPIGYFAFEDGPTDCPKVWPSLRWDMGVVQPLWADYALDLPRMRTVMTALTQDARVGKVFLEPHLTDQLGASHPKLRFQGCRAARHDDHIHLQL
nr:hypothetical protein [Nereida sp. MMG025]